MNQMRAGDDIFMEEELHRNMRDLIQQLEGHKIILQALNLFPVYLFIPGFIIIAILIAILDQGLKHDFPKWVAFIFLIISISPGRGGDGDRAEDRILDLPSGR